MFFIAITIPETIRNLLTEASTFYSDWLRSTVPPERLHLTLLWLGATQDVQRYQVALTEPFTSVFVPTVSLLYVGRGKVGKQLWAYAQPSLALSALQKEIITRFEQSLLPFPKPAPWVPHVKLANLSAAAEQAAIADRPLKITPFVPRELLLFQSQATSHGRVYTALGTLAVQV